MNKEERIERIRQLLLQAKEKEKEWKNIIEEIIKLSVGLKDYLIDLNNYSIHEIERGGGA